jgi:hypothetical protein
MKPAENRFRYDSTAVANPMATGGRRDPAVPTEKSVRIVTIDVKAVHE